MLTFIHLLRRRFRALVNSGAVDRDLDREIRAHLELEAADLARTKGLTPEDARREAAIAFGGVDRFAEEHRDARGVRWMPELASDIRYSLRALARSPGFTISATLVLALGIGASIAVFSAVDAVLLAKLPYADDAQLVRIFQQTSPENRWTLSTVDLQAIQKYSRTISAMGGFRGGRVGVSAGGDAERLAVGRVNAGFFDAFGVNAAVGRRIAPADEPPGAPAVVVLTDAYAARAFGSAASALGRDVTIDGVSHRVVGVMHPEHARLANIGVDMWSALRHETPTRRGPFGMFGFARLRPGVTLDAARAELADISERIYPEWRAGFGDSTAKLTPYSLRETIIGTSARPMSLFLAAVTLVLLIAIANAASLSIVRSMRRWREISLRATLGASRSRLVRLIVTESVTLAVIAGVLGVALGWFGIRALQVFATGIPRLENAHIDARAVLVAAALAVIAGIAMGIVPAMRLFSGGRSGRLDGARTIGDGHRTNRARAVFVGAEFALALPLLAAGALLLTSLMRLQRVDPGFAVDGLLTVRIGVPAATYRGDVERRAFWSRVASNVAEIPGVTAAGYGTAAPPDDFGASNDNFNLVDSPVPPGGSEPNATWPAVNTEFFASLGVRLLDGRLFAAGDTAGATPVIVVTETWAKRYYPGRSPLGRELIRGGCAECPRTVIVGVVSDVTFDDLRSPGEAMFSPITAGWPSQMNLFVRAPRQGDALVAGVRAAIRAADPAAATGPMEMMETRIYNSVAQPRHLAIILIAFAVAALAMACVGVFGLLSYAVELRRREIGVRMALGAPAGQVVMSMVGSGMRCAAIGAMIGVALTLVASRWLRTLLYDVSAVDPATLLAVTLGLLAVALAASWAPARRAARIDPAEAMRGE